LTEIFVYLGVIIAGKRGEAVAEVMCYCFGESWEVATAVAPTATDAPIVFAKLSAATSTFLVK